MEKLYCSSIFLFLGACLLPTHLTAGPVWTTNESSECNEKVTRLRQIAERGDAKAQYELGVLYDSGDCVIQDLSEAAKLYAKAAEQGNCHAQYNLGNMYHKGDGVRQNSVEAAKWYRQSAEEGNAAAQLSLALLYEHGDGVQKNDEESAKWYIRSANQGEPSAQNNLAWHYFMGQGVAKNAVMADSWLIVANQNGAGLRTSLSRVYFELSISNGEIKIAKQIAASWRPNLELNKFSSNKESCSHYPYLMPKH